MLYESALIQPFSAFQLREDLPYPYEPEWFLAAEKNKQIFVKWLPTMRFGNTDPLRQKYASSFVVPDDRFGYLLGEEGDYAILFDDGKVFPNSREFFESMFYEVK